VAYKILFTFFTESFFFFSPAYVAMTENSLLHPASLFITFSWTFILLSYFWLQAVP